MRNSTRHVELDVDDFGQLNQGAVAHRWLKCLTQLGDKVTLKPAAA
jgi:hypothetical protein